MKGQILRARISVFRINELEDDIILTDCCVFESRKIVIRIPKSDLNSYLKVKVLVWYECFECFDFMTLMSYDTYDQLV